MHRTIITTVGPEGGKSILARHFGEPNLGRIGRILHRYFSLKPAEDGSVQPEIVDTVTVERRGENGWEPAFKPLLTEGGVELIPVEADDSVVATIHQIHPESHGQ